MKEDDETIVVGTPLPKVFSVEKGHGPYDVVVVWADGLRRGRTDVIDVAPQIFTFKVYKPLRDDSDLFAHVGVSEDATAIIWPGNADLEISADALEDLAEQTMTNAAFADFMKAMGWTLELTAAQLGISRRQVAYYAKERDVPRYIALACHALRQDLQRGSDQSGVEGRDEFTSSSAAAAQG